MAPGPSPIASQPIQTISSVNQPYRQNRGGPPKGISPQRGIRGGYQRGQRRAMRPRGGVGGYQRRPPLY